MLWWMWLLLAFAMACVVAMWLARGRRDEADDPLLLMQAERESSIDRYSWIQKARRK